MPEISEKEEEVVFEVREIDDKNIEITATNKHGIMKTRIFLWPRDIFE